MYVESRQPVFKDITPKDAEAFLAINNFPGQRVYNAIKGRSYADKMASGEQRRIEIAVAKVKENGRDYLMNGQHNCNAILIRGKPYPGVVSYYMCDTMEDAWRLFATFDVHATRTESQFMASRRGLFTDERLRNVQLRTLQCCGTALYSLGSGTEPTFNLQACQRKTDKPDAVAKFAEDVLFVSKFSEYRDMLIVVPVVTAMIATYRKNPAAANDFWSFVASGEMLASQDPRKKLREILLRPGRISSLRGRDRNKALYSLCVSWWNAWRDGKMRKTVKLAAMTSVPKVSG